MGGTFRDRVPGLAGARPARAAGAPTSPRLVYRPLGDGDLDAFHALVTDDHIKRYMMDGQTLERAWAAAEIARSRELLARCGVGLWLVFERGLADRAADAPAGPPIGFCGFRVYDEHGPGPEFLYAFLEPYTGRGYATEAGRALIAHARAAGLGAIDSAADEPNQASIRVLHKLGFRPVGTAPGAFGRVVLFQLPE